MLKPYTPSDFSLLQSWITDPDMLFQFAGTEFSYPVTEIQIQGYLERNPDRLFYVGYTPDKNPFSFGEIIPQQNNTPRLGRLLVGDPNLRGKGLGTYFVESLVEECQKLYNTNTVDLYVWDNNVSAIKCYRKVGFEFVVIDPFILVRNGVEYNLLKMTLTIKNQ